MDVYLVPCGPHGFELYCESTVDSAPPQLDASGGLWKRLYARFVAIVAAIEREQDRARAAQAESAGFTRRLRVRSLRWLAERIAEQRLLWRLRGQTRVRAHYPAGFDPQEALRTVRSSLDRDLRRHAVWLVFDTIGGLFSLLLVPLPGPNLPGYYFTFRIVGHLLAILGARQGLRVVAWEARSNDLLAELGRLEHVPEAEREERVRAIANELGLPRLARFFERTAVEAA